MDSQKITEAVTQSYANEHAKTLHRALAAEAALALVQQEVAGLREELAQAKASDEPEE